MQIGAFDVQLPDPPLRRPHCVAMLRPWVNVGNVGAIVLGRLSKLFGGTEVGRLSRPSEFYDFTRYRPEMKLKGSERVVTVPNTVVMTARRPTEPDLILMQMLEPHNRAEDFNDSILKVLDALGANRYVMVGGMYDSVPHSRPLPVTGTARNWEPPRNMGGVQLGDSSYQGPTSLTSQLTQRAYEHMGLETMSLIVHLPLYLKLDDDFEGASRLLKAISSVYKLGENLPEYELGEKQYAQVAPAMANNPQLAQLVAKFEKEFDTQEAKRLAEQAEQERKSKSELAPEIEAFLNQLESPPDGGASPPETGGI